MKAVIPTFSGRLFDVLNPDQRDVCIEDIAHGLSMECRYSGQARHFYSVAEHSLMVSRWAQHAALTRGAEVAESRMIGLWGLLHDASEAYGLRDISVPILRHAEWASGYKEAHRRVMQAVCFAFGLPESEPEEVKTADRRMVTTEWDTLIHFKIPYSFYVDPPPERYEGELSCLSHEKAEQLFLMKFRHLTR